MNNRLLAVLKYTRPALPAAAATGSAAAFSTRGATICASKLKVRSALKVFAPEIVCAPSNLAMFAERLASGRTLLYSSAVPAELTPSSAEPAPSEFNPVPPLATGSTPDAPALTSNKGVVQFAPPMPSALKTMPLEAACEETFALVTACSASLGVVTAASAKSAERMVSLVISSVVIELGAAGGVAPPPPVATSVVSLSRP
jgi:hypothetical protein